jgi:hypothetical protein
MTPAFLIYVAAKRKADQRIRNQFTSNLPKGIV